MPLNSVAGISPANSWRTVPEGAVSGLSGSTAPFSDAPANLRAITFAVEAQAIRFRRDGRTVTSTTGIPLAVGVYYEEMTQAQAKQVRVIESASSATMVKQYWVEVV